LIPVTLLCSWTVPDREQDRSSCVRMCGCEAEDLPWETCGSVDVGGSGKPEFDSPSSSSSESMVNSFRNFGNGNSYAVRNWKENRWYIRIYEYYCPLLLLRDASTNRWHHTEVTVSCMITWLPPNHRISKWHR